jgi:hypothetical protein
VNRDQNTYLAHHAEPHLRGGRVDQAFMQRVLAVLLVVPRSDRPRIDRGPVELRCGHRGQRTKLIPRWVIGRHSSL